MTVTVPAPALKPVERSVLPRLSLARWRDDPVLFVFVVGVAIVALLFTLTALNAGGQASLRENAHWTAGVAVALAVTLLAARRSEGRAALIRGWLAISLAVYFVGQIMWDVQVANSYLAVPAPSDIFYLGSTAAAVVALAVAVHGRVSNLEERAVYIDAALVFFAISTGVLALYEPTAAQSGLAGFVLLAYPIFFMATAGAALVGALAGREKPGFRGAYVALFGFALNGLAWLIWIEASLTAFPGPGSPINYLFTIAMLLVGFGAATWTDEVSESPIYAGIASTLRDALPSGALLFSVGILIFQTTPAVNGIQALHVAPAIVVALSLVRQWVLSRENGRVLEQVRSSVEREQLSRERAQESLDAQRERAQESLDAQRESETRYRSTVDTFNRLSERISFASTDTDVVSAVAIAMPRLVPSCRGDVLLQNPSEDRLIVAAAWGDDRPAIGSSPPIDKPIQCPGIRRGSPYQIADASDDLSPGCPAHPASQGSVLCVPMLAMGQIIGVVHLQRPEVDAFEIDTQYQASRVAEQAALALANARLVRTMEGLAMTDPLTGLHNARFFDPLMDRELAAASREGRSLAVAMIDLDHFKQFNDAHGHPAGDEALRAFARTVLGAIRESDTVARYGGEEFVVLLRNTDLDGAARAAEKIRTALELLVVEIGPGRFGRITASFGVASTDAQGSDRLELLKEADQALYEAKQLGRNRVVAAPRLIPPVGAAAHPAFRREPALVANTASPGLEEQAAG